MRIDFHFFAVIATYAGTASLPVRVEVATDRVVVNSEIGTLRNKQTEFVEPNLEFDNHIAARADRQLVRFQLTGSMVRLRSFLFTAQYINIRTA